MENGEVIGVIGIDIGLDNLQRNAESGRRRFMLGNPRSASSVLQVYCPLTQLTVPRLDPYSTRLFLKVLKAGPMLSTKVLRNRWKAVKV